MAGGLNSQKNYVHIHRHPDIKTAGLDDQTDFQKNQIHFSDDKTEYLDTEIV